jgi:hypothetical protein
MKGGAFQGKGGGGGAGGADGGGGGGGGGKGGGGGGGRGGAQRPKGGGKGGRGGGRSQLERLERKLHWGGFDDRQEPEKASRARCARASVCPQRWAASHRGGSLAVHNDAGLPRRPLTLPPSLASLPPLFSPSTHARAHAHTRAHAQVTVVLSSMFDPRELESTLGAAEELEGEVAQECGRIGPVEKARPGLVCLCVCVCLRACG